MARYAVNFAVTVWVDTEDINVGEIDDDVTNELSDTEWNSLTSEALEAMEIGTENIVSIERIEEEED